MAALSDATRPEVLELPHLTIADIDPLLNEEISVWDQRFAWDFRPSADLLRRFLQIHSLHGCALRSGSDIVGYSYYVCEERKGLIGDFYVRRRSATGSAEMLLLGSVVQALMLTPGIRRIESQLMMLGMPPTQPLPFSKYLIRHDRFFLETDYVRAQEIATKATGIRVSFVPWADRYHEETAHLIAASYKGHVDSEINDQYRSIPGARQFLNNIIRFPGCGQFSAEGSMVAIDENSGKVCGVCLASLISAHSGHVTQLCVLPAVRGAHVGYELLRRTLERLITAACTSISLTVTCSNVDAIRLYQSVGFQVESTFPALVWEGF